METVSDEVVMVILGFTPPVDLLCQVSRVAKRFADLIHQDSFWRLYSLSPAVDNTSHEQLNLLTKHQIQRYSLYTYSMTMKHLALLHTNEPSSLEGEIIDDSDDDQDDIPLCLRQESLFVPRSTAMFVRRANNNNRDATQKRCCLASSTEHIEEEMLENVLLEPIEEPLPRTLGRDYANHNGPRWIFEHLDLRWWSSMPHPKQKSKETLLFCTRSPLAVISELRIKPLREPYQSRGQVYSWRRTVVRAYLKPLAAEEEEEENLDASAMQDLYFTANPDTAQKETIEDFMNHHDPVITLTRDYTHPIDSCKVVTIPLPPGIMANVVAVELHGKNHEQGIGRGYYACVERVDCRGIPLPRTRTVGEDLD